MKGLSETSSRPTLPVSPAKVLLLLSVSIVASGVTDLTLVLETLFPDQKASPTPLSPPVL